MTSYSIGELINIYQHSLAEDPEKSSRSYSPLHRADILTEERIYKTMYQDPFRGNDSGDGEGSIQ